MLSLEHRQIKKLALPSPHTCVLAREQPESPQVGEQDSQLPVIFCQGLYGVGMVPLYLITFFGFCSHELVCFLQVNIDSESRNNVSGTLLL